MRNFAEVLAEKPVRPMGTDERSAQIKRRRHVAITPVAGARLYGRIDVLGRRGICPRMANGDKFRAEDGTRGHMSRFIPGLVCGSEKRCARRCFSARGVIIT
jgi:hypothetical protein